ncbi:bifunctional glutamate N-acetyltransferase/amino-acid acetyltransferase ArgJ [Alicyclobacillus cycloheptanicus]|uniref:Arginine biosynthesis bifunctional protein ArgJ n=1 Tax=Alicyclobacillus cycloheptanicus TaxID=1457 RepID=A0ABT9XIG9_9BACL|nr:bifunctional glutamate N-acetyltransferase/amino-acid acetyltransferase ArgJ [Alicyclobacillus cycloheptanicus]MDQ0190101.1 glutamate N-acetyltransferase/amino-acid N-acetyltransferase [Alicyclobacillus cycloheptanicus]WDM02075.1 bifunctional glutamate N-acetyltransferase/amino-acid acetyltransferase ArgJ [Alicyclobacillus cycloheptanicus]
MKVIEGGVTAPVGFRAAGVAAGIKPSGRDVAVVLSDADATAAAVFTQSLVKAAPVVYSQGVMNNGGPVRAIVINSGNANACTGAAGERHAAQMAEAAAKGCGVLASEVLVASTGVIGVPLPIERVLDGIAAACHALEPGVQSAGHAVEAIMTTDTVPKQIAVQVEVDGTPVTIGGMAKGSGMIHPNMATMLGVVTTDARLPRGTLQTLLRETVDVTFNMISVDGDTSTNDTVAVLANGMAGGPELTAQHPGFETFRAAFRYVLEFLAKEIARDGEGATKFIEVSVRQARTAADARALVKTVLTSSLVKTAFFGEDANWGRILAAMGRAGAAFDVARVSIAFASAAGLLELMRDGEPVPFDEEEAKRVLRPRDIQVSITLQDGTAEATGWGCDLSYEYVRINGDYRT